MSNLYVAGELGAAKGRVLLGALHKDGLTVSSAGDLRDLTTDKDGTPQWDIPRIYQQVLTVIHGIVAQEEPVRGISFHSSATDALLFEQNGSLISPASRAPQGEPTTEYKKVLTKISAAELYDETGIQTDTGGMLNQLVSESSRRLRKANHALSVADAFNYLFSAVPRMEVSQANLTQLYNPVGKNWSERVLKASGLAPKLFPEVVPSGTKLGDVRPDIANNSGLEDARVVATCSHELAASLAALNLANPGPWAFLYPDQSTLMGTRMAEPSINDVSREMGYSNLVGYRQSIGFYKSWPGLRLVEACKHAWQAQDRAMDSEVLMHLATSATPFEALIDPADPRFSTAADMPQAIQAFCRDTNQEVPRKPGPILRCVLESLALHYRKGLMELEYITGSSFSHLYVLGGKSTLLLNHFLANALQMPVTIVPTEIAGLGNVLIQALTLGHIPSQDHAHEMARQALKMQTINPHAAAWTDAYDRFLGLTTPAQDAQQGTS